MGRVDQRSAEAQAYRPLYKTARWQRTREHQKRKQPLCEWCLAKGQVVPMAVCHHEDPKAKLKPETFFAGPFISLCQPCHDSTAQQRERIGYSTEIGEDGWPTDPKHPANKKR